MERFMSRRAPTGLAPAPGGVFRRCVDPRATVGRRDITHRAVEPPGGRAQPRSARDAPEAGNSLP